MKRNNHLFILMITICIGITSTMSVWAADSNLLKAEGVSGTVIETPSQPLGILSADESDMLMSSECTDCPEVYHFSTIPHSHEITRIRRQYHGEINRGIVAETTRRVNTTSTLSYERNRNISNSFDVSIGFDRNVISGTLGYNVSFSDSATASYSVDVPANMLASITLYDMYDVTEFDARTTYVYNTVPLSYSYENGSGWAQQWTNFGFSSRIW